MLAKLRRAHAPPPQIHEPPPPPPPASARREKEGRWLRSIGRSGGAAGSAGQESAAEGAGGASGSSRGRAQSVRSSRSTGSFRLFGGGGGGGSGSCRASRDARDVGSGDGIAPDGSERVAATTRGSLAPPSASSSRSRPQPHPSSSSTSSFASADALPGGQDPPVSLAQRLQELAVANADGLLDEDEYRILRGQVFESSVTSGSGGQGGAAGAFSSSTAHLGEGHLAVPSLKRLEQEARRASTSSTDALQSLDRAPPSPASAPSAHPVPASSTRRQSLAPDPHRTPSLAYSARSKRTSGLRGLFRRPSTASVRAGEVEPLGEGWTHVASPTLVPSASSPNLGDGASTLSASTVRRPRRSIDAPAGARSLGGADGYSTNRTRSVRHHPGLASSAFASSSSPRFTSADSSPELGRPGSVSGRSVGSATTTRTSPASQLRAKFPSSSFAASTTRSHASPGSTSSSAHYASAPLPPLPSARDPAALVTPDLSALELRSELDEIEGEWRRVRGAWDALAREEVRRWEEEVGSEVVWGLSGLALAPPGEPNGNFGGSLGRRGSTAARSILSTPTISTSTDLLRQPELPSFLLASSPSPIPPGLPEDIDLVTRAVQQRVRELHNRQAATDDKYSRRVDFLRARLRAAELRQRLR
ncbi:hypothetical protein JCM9279_004821 [Rhodotorula babjevae]